MKLLRALFVVALILAVAAPLYAETQNVKVSGGIDSYWFYRRNYDLNKNGGDVNVPSSSGDSQGDDWFQTAAQVEVAADLTDNVSTVINLYNERDWNSHTSSPISPGDHGGDIISSYEVKVDKAYVQMKEIFYSPLTLTIGRQDLWFGRGFIVGNNVRTWDPTGSISAPEYSLSTAFDALRATLDFNPWTIDFVYSKIFEGNVNRENDIDLYVANVNYKFAEYNAVAEGYWVGEWDRSTTDLTGNQKASNTETLGGRVQFDPISQITLGGEAAYQFGTYQDSGTNFNRDRGAWAADIFGTYRWDYTWKPEITVEYVYFSGETDMTSTSTASYGAWNGLYRGKFWTAYGDFRGWVYSNGVDNGTVAQNARSNDEFIQVKGALKPLEDLLLEGSFTYFWTPEAVNSVPSNTNSSTLSKDLGYEIDLQATYDYTEDVSFGLLVGWFVPGNYYSSPNDVTATDIVSSVKVTF